MTWVCSMANWFSYQPFQVKRKYFPRPWHFNAYCRKILMFARRAYFSGHPPKIVSGMHLCERQFSFVTAVITFFLSLWMWNVRMAESHQPGIFIWSIKCCFVFLPCILLVGIICVTDYGISCDPLSSERLASTLARAIIAILSHDQFPLQSARTSEQSSATMSPTHDTHTTKAHFQQQWKWKRGNFYSTQRLFLFTINIYFYCC